MSDKFDFQRALVIGASGGIGQAIAAALSEQGIELVGKSRRAGDFDLTDEGSIARMSETLSGPFDLIIVATGALVVDGQQPEKSMRQLSAKAMQSQFAINAIGPALLIKHLSKHLPKTQRSVFASLTARVGSIGDNRLGGWTSYRAAKAAANQIIRTSAIELARSHPKLACVALHPGTVKTDLTQAYLARHDAQEPAQAAHNILRVLSERVPSDTGCFFDWKGDELAW